MGERPVFVFIVDRRSRAFVQRAQGRDDGIVTIGTLRRELETDRLDLLERNRDVGKLESIGITACVLAPSQRMGIERNPRSGRTAPVWGSGSANPCTPCL